MKNLTVKLLDHAEIDWSAQEKALIDHYMWDSDYMPEAYAQAVYCKTGDEKEGIYFHLFCRESEPRAIYTKHNEPVFRDSCLEVFFTMKAPGAEDHPYLNIESNANPTTLIGFGRNRYDRTPLVELGYEPFAVTGKRTADTWELFEFIPVSVLRSLFLLDSIDETTLVYGNFYKCGGDHPILPYGMWSPIDTPTPDFHRSEFFGRLTLTK